MNALHRVVLPVVVAMLATVARGAEVGTTSAGKDNHAVAIAQPRVITLKEFEGTDVERINRAIDAAAAAGCRVVIPRANLSVSQRWGGKAYGTDVGVVGESQTGEWRNLGILLDFVKTTSFRTLRSRIAASLVAGSIATGAATRGDACFCPRNDDASAGTMQLNQMST